MFSICVESVFSAAHALVIQGQREALHGHDWRVTATIQGPVLDEDALLWDFHALQADLAEVIAPFRNANLNEVEPFSRMNPSAEAVAAHIGKCLVSRLTSRLARYPKTEWAAGLRVASVGVTEGPGCRALYRPE
jgi:6-pyruvoyltetrahydropterin/6-carboxytetrahydropterin synthase